VRKEPWVLVAGGGCGGSCSSVRSMKRFLEVEAYSQKRACVNLLSSRTNALPAAAAKYDRL
jgi:hypothetical protein